MKKKEVYTVSSVDVTNDNPVELSVVGSFKDRNSAVKECVEYIVERIGLRPDIRYALMHDANHEDVASVVAKEIGKRRCDILRKFAFKMKDEWSIGHEIETAIMKKLEDEFSISSVYEMRTDPDSDIGAETFIFDISKNPLE